jgi:uncharacterized membrane protein
MKAKVPSALKSRKFWMAIAGALLPVLNEQLGLGISQETLTMALLMLGSFIGVEGVADIVSRKNSQ